MAFLGDFCSKNGLTASLQCCYIYIYYLHVLHWNSSWDVRFGWFWGKSSPFLGHTLAIITLLKDTIVLYIYFVFNTYWTSQMTVWHIPAFTMRPDCSASPTFYNETRLPYLFCFARQDQTVLLLLIFTNTDRDSLKSLSTPPPPLHTHPYRHTHHAYTRTPNPTPNPTPNSHCSVQSERAWAAVPTHPYPYRHTPLYTDQTPNPTHKTHCRIQSRRAWAALPTHPYPHPHPYRHKSIYTHTRTHAPTHAPTQGHAHPIPHPTLTTWFKARGHEQHVCCSSQSAKACVFVCVFVCVCVCVCVWCAVPPCPQQLSICKSTCRFRSAKYG